MIKYMKMRKPRCQFVNIAQTLPFGLIEANARITTWTLEREILCGGRYSGLFICNANSCAFLNIPSSSSNIS